LVRRLRDMDVFGHSIKVNYKSSESYQSLLGGLLTLAVYSLTLI